jgi:hypothetical protein
MRARLETAALALASLAVLAFVLSFALGIRLPRADAGGDGGVAPRGAADPMGAVRPAIGRVEVLNGSGRTGMARVATERLRTGGYDVVYLGNAPAADSSSVIDRVGRPEIARGAASRLGIARTLTAVDTTLYVDATVVIGADWERGSAAGPAVSAEAPAGPETGWRHRVRRLFGR